MRKIKYIGLAAIVVSTGVMALVLWLQGTPEDRLVRTYQNRFDERKAEIDRSLEALPPPFGGAVLHKAKLADVRDTRIAIADLKALKEPAQVYRSRVQDPFAARLHYWQPGRLNKDKPTRSSLTGIWPTEQDKLAEAYEHFLTDGPCYLAVVRPITWKEPDASQTPIKAGFTDLEVFVLDVKKSEVLASTRWSYDQSEQKIISYNITVGAQHQAEYELRSEVHHWVHHWVASLFAADQKVRIGSLEYDYNGQLKEPKTP